MAFKNRELTDKPLFPVGVNIFAIRDNKMLLGKRLGSRQGYNGQWGMPGGHLEEGEHMRECAARELMEETGMTATGFRFVNADNDPRQDGFHYVHFGFLAEGLAGEPENREPDKCGGWEWFPLDALPEPLFVGHAKLIRGYFAGMPFVE